MSTMLDSSATGLFVVSRCAVCQSEKTLRLCTGCECIKYCSGEHQTQHWSTHKQLCNTIKKTISETKKEFLKLIERPDTPPLGQFGITPDSLAYLNYRFSLVKTCAMINSREGLDEAISHALVTLGLGRRDLTYVRYMVPFFMLRLDKDQECYNFMSWWQMYANSIIYDWTDDDAPYLDILYMDPIEDLHVFCSRDPPLAFLVAVTLLKIKLLIDFKGLKNHQQVKDNTPSEQSVSSSQEFVPRSNALSYGNMLRKSNWDKEIKSLDRQVSMLVEVGHMTNPHYWPALLDPARTSLIDVLPDDSSAMKEMRKVLGYSLEAWMENEGALGYVEAAYKEEWSLE